MVGACAQPRGSAGTVGGAAQLVREIQEQGEISNSLSILQSEFLRVMLRAFADAGHTVTGVDISADMLGRARQLLEAGAVPRDRFTLELVGEHFRGKFLEQSYDAIVCIGLLEYLPDPYGLL